jgi:hypothetical protein
MAITISTASRNAACDAVVDLVDVSGPGTLKFYTAGFATLLATLTFSNPAFGAAATGTATANAITADTSADATGTAASFKIFDGAGAEILLGSVGTSGQDINFNTVSWTTGDNISVSSLTVTMPAA